MKSELTDQEKQELHDIDKFNATTGRQGWHVKGKLFKEQNIARIELNNSSLSNVDLQSVKGRGAVISNSKFERVRFLSGDFTGSTFSRVEFDDCDFGGADFKDTKFENCTFRKCRAEDVRMENVVFDTCTFDDLTDKSGIYTNAQFLKTQLRDAKWHNTALRRAHFESSEFVGGILELTIFGNVSVASLKFSGLTVNSCSFNEAKIEGMLLENCRIKGMTFGKADAVDLKFVGCDGLAGLNVVNSNCRRLSIERCQRVSEPKFYLSKLSEWSMRDCSLHYLYCVETEFSVSGVISNCSITGANFSQAKMSGVTVENSSFAKYLVLSGGVFEGLVLKSVTYDKDLEIDEDNVTYANSDKFPSK